jgi:glucose-6-phosphate isomerase
MNNPPIRLANFGSLDAHVRSAIAALEAENIVPRIWARDHRVWKNRDEEIGNRLGWLTAPDDAAAAVIEASRFAAEVKAEGIEHVLLLGMGGSSLAPEVFGRVLGPVSGFPALHVLDSTDPSAVLHFRKTLPPDRTLFIVSSKSGSTLETSSFLKYFFAETSALLGPEAAGRRFAAVTDPGSSLEHLGARLGFRRVFAGDPDIGGRFSVLSPFGLVPAALLGIDVQALLASASRAAAACRAGIIPENPGALLGALLGTAAREGLDKMAVLLPPRLESLGAWIEQLVAESTGKEGRGILPLVRRDPQNHVDTDGLIEFGDDVLWVVFDTPGDTSWRAAAKKTADAGRPMITIATDGLSGLGEQFFLWEFATAVTGHVLGINPFDQPNVASAKKKTDAVLEIYRRTGSLPKSRPVYEDVRLAVEGRAFATEVDPQAKPGAPAAVETDFETSEAADALRRFVGRAGRRDYLALQAFLPPHPAVAAALRWLALRLQTAVRRPAVYDFGPRFLHSTGQLHKGDRGNGLFIQLTGAHDIDAAIPMDPDSTNSEFTFGTLIDAQACGDREALQEMGRRLLRIHLRGDPAQALNGLAASLT